MSMPTVHDLPQHHRQIFRQAGLDSKRRASLSNRPLACAWQTITRHDDDRDIARARISFDVMNELPPVEPWA